MDGAPFCHFPAFFFFPARVYRPSTEHALYQWLSSNSLSYYFISFIQSELTDLRKIAQLSLPSEELYDELEIILPGHRKRLERAGNIQ